MILKGLSDDFRDLVGKECKEPLLDPLVHQAFLDNPGELEVNLISEELHVPLFDAPDEQLIEDEKVFGPCGFHHLEVPLDLKGRLGPRQRVLGSLAKHLIVQDDFGSKKH